jgi:hypothetical protein
MSSLSPFIVEFVFPLLLCIGIVVIVFRCFSPRKRQGEPEPGEARDESSTADPNEWKTAWPIWWMVLGVFVVMVSIWLGLLMMFANQ